ncbi:hypothetical protein DY000_02051910 [Brassica cretica]|uniref:Uncharacterized protein n=1 Tax=Brassica cretica TaxID=69181 RepID=A0ABQ7AN23_BRACR|nr:hypothetical protein DY000_02051910 [Brassica cretica]
MTRFRCDGVALGLSWAHIMGDPLSLSHFFNLWTRALAGEEIYCPKTSDSERAKAREESEPVTITIIRSDPNGLKPKAVRNSQMISSVHVDFSVAEAKLEEIVKSIGEATDERSEIDEIGERDDGVLDFVFYGAKLTFVDLTEVDFYEAKVKETSPRSVYCNVQGTGDEGAVVVMPAAAEEERVVAVTLTEDDVEKVKWELKKCRLITAWVNREYISKRSIHICNSYLKDKSPK